jgi:hypothetical protein
MESSEKNIAVIIELKKIRFFFFLVDTIVVAIDSKRMGHASQTSGPCFPRSDVLGDVTHNNETQAEYI